MEWVLFIIAVVIGGVVASCVDALIREWERRIS